MYMYDIYVYVCIIPVYIANVYIIGYMPRTPWLGYVTWRPRQHNARADGLCNLSLDLGHTVFSVTSSPAVDKIIVHSDGARRASGLCSLGFTVETVVNGTRHLAMQYAKPIRGNYSSFSMELKALHFAPEYVLKLVMGE